MTTTEMPGADAGFRAVNITKHFAGVPALSGISFALRPGEVVGLVGHNGAGKSTLLKTLAGAHRYDGGELYLDGEAVNFSNPSEALAHGVATVYQELSLLPNLTVLENMWLGHELIGARGLRKADMAEQAQALLDEFGLDLDLEKKLETYSVATRQLLEIAIATSKNTRYLLLDEPTTSLEGEQIGHLLTYIKRLVQKKNVGILLVDHKLDELYDVADRIVALVDGKVILDADAKGINHEDVVRAIVGNDAAEVAIQEQATRVAKDFTDAEVALEVKCLRGPNLNGVHLTTHVGEVVGLYGLVGAGRTEFLRTLIGVEPLEEGELRVFGKEYRPKNPTDAMKHGFAYLTEERKIDGIVPRMSSPQNVALPVLKNFSRKGFLQSGRLKGMTSDFVKKLRVKGDVSGPIEELSGGNQQKVLIARTLAQNPKILLLDEPTKGVDIGVKAEIHALLRTMAQEGISLIVVSSEEEEILEVSDSVVVFAGGQSTCDPLPVDQLSIAKLREMAWSNK
ncbi:sugar ABC transporter ATP-binding protein [Arcanobacterium ihumii]|uniref:sugar ABC transporter ATP-binding protein n=1 Tax=Arcanobacterium ihumii TaxID=2138162 RepID=UPI000F53CAB6|nr:sugar ABC transporter ATP-binding protein [Arcanobacterium ihumii]